MFKDILFKNGIDIIEKVKNGCVSHHFLKGDFFKKGDIVRLIQLNKDCSPKDHFKVAILMTMTLTIDYKSQNIFIEESGVYTKREGTNLFIAQSVFEEKDFWNHFRQENKWIGQILIWGNLKK